MFVFAVFVLWSMAVIQYRAYSALPFWDMWGGYWAWYLKPHPNLFVRLFAQHNEHRIAVARLFFLADQMFFQGRAVFIFISIYLVQFLHAVLLWRLGYLSQPHRKTISLFIGSVAFLCLFSALQYTNFTWSFEIQFVAVYFAATAAIASLMAYANVSAADLIAGSAHRRIWLSSTVLVGVVATYSMANGLMVWPILLLEAFWFGLRRPVKLTFFVAWVAMWTLYFRGYTTPSQTSSIRDGFHNLPRSFAFAMCALGSPLNGILSEITRIFSIGSENWQLFWAAVAGLIGFIMGAYLCIHFARIRRVANLADGAIVHLLLFLLASVLLMGFGRQNFPLQYAAPFRYATPPLLFWFCLLFLSCSLVGRRYPARFSQSLLLLQFASVVMALLVVVLCQPTRLRYARVTLLYQDESEAAISALVYDPDLWGRATYDPRGIIPTVRYLQKNHLSIFAPKRLRWLGDPISAHYGPTAPGSCVGSIDDVQLLPDSELPGIRLHGWAWNTQSRRIARSMVLTDKLGRILGFGYTGFDRPDVPAAHPEIERAVGWVAYVPGTNHDFIAAYLVTGDGKTCLVGTRELSVSAGAPLAQIGEALPSIPASIQGAWTKRGHYPGSEPPPIKTNVIVSWVKRDGDTGTIRLGSFPAGSSEAVRNNIH
jgi:hypothetical protein